MCTRTRLRLRFRSSWTPVAFLLLTVYLFVDPPSRWMARVEALSRDIKGRGCFRAAPHAPKEPLPSPSSPPRLLICMPVGPYEPSRFPHTVIAVAEVLAYSHFSVTVSIDTTSQASANALATRFSAPLAGGSLLVRLWSVDALVRLWPLATGLLTGEPAAFLLSHAHRLYMHERAAEYEWLAYVEDDMLVPEAAMVLAAERARDLWPLGWLAGFLRIENDLVSGVPAATDLRSSDMAGTRVFQDYADRRYAQLSNGYAAGWILSRTQLRSFVSEPSGVYKDGPTAFDVRARMSWGYTQALAPDGRWVPRVLLPLAEDGSVDPRALVFHLPNNYCATSHCMQLKNISAALAEMSGLPLPVHAVLPCV